MGKIDPVQGGSGLQLLREDSSKLVRGEKSIWNSTFKDAVIYIAKNQWTVQRPCARVYP